MKRYQSFEYVFIVTYGRSGSTLVQGLLNSVPGCDIKGENKAALFYLYESLCRVRDSKLNYKDSQLMTGGRASPWYGIDDVSDESYWEDCLDSFVRNIIKPTTDARLIGFKEIRYMPRRFMPFFNGGLFINEGEFCKYCEFLLSFPKAKIIFNKRQATDVAKSGMWVDYDSTHIVGMVTLMDSWFDSFHLQYPLQTHTLVYDDYIRDHDLLRDMFDFLGLSVQRQHIDEVLSAKLLH